jgi:hypothetical protein
MNSRLFLVASLLCLLMPQMARTEQSPTTASVVSLDGSWLLAVDPKNVGRQQGWFTQPVADAKTAKVPWIIQGTFPAYHGVAWYWRDFDAPVNPIPGGRYLLRFSQVDYLAEVWLDGASVGGHEGGETPFVLDVTDRIKPGRKNRLAVRVLNPTNDMIDGICLNQTARRCKNVVFGAGGAFNHGGITGSVELLCVPTVHVSDLFAKAHAEQTKGVIHVQAQLRNAVTTAKGHIDITVSSGRTGETTAMVRLEREFPAGQSTVEADLNVDNPRLWQLNDPYLYRVTVRVQLDDATSFDEQSTRCGFRDFRFTNGYFRLNGQRIFLRSCHTCNHYPIGQQFPHDPDLLRRDLLNLKVMGFNAVRFIWGAATPLQLDLCDEIGLMVYEESYASMWIEPSPKMAERFDAGVCELVRRDRNHPCVIMWGLLNESPDHPAFHHAVKMLPMVRELDDTRIIMLNSGRYDGVGMGSGIGAVAGILAWPKGATTEPWVGKNVSKGVVQALGITWPSGYLAFHPGPKNEYSVVRWTAPASGEIEISARFQGLASPATTDVHVFHKGHAIFDALLNINGSANEAGLTKRFAVAAGDTIDCAVGFGNGSHGGDTTGLVFSVKQAGKTYDATAEFSPDANPNGVWSYGQFPPGAAPNASSLAIYGDSGSPGRIGSLSNPGSMVWEDVISDRHIYPRVPHTGETIASLRNLDASNGQNVFLSEYGIGSAVDLWRGVRHYEQLGAAEAEDAVYLRDKLDRYMVDWNQWRLDELYARPEDFFMESLKKMAGQRTLGLNAIRSNPNIVGHSMTCAIEEVMCGEGLTTLFRELKPGTIDAVFDGWAPLRWCLFAEPVHIRRGTKLHLEAVLANEDVLTPGEYPARLQVIGPNMTRVMDRTITVAIPKRGEKPEPRLAQLCFSDDVAIDGPSGKYRFLATFLRGAAAAGGETEFYVTDPADMPSVKTDVVLWGDNADLAKWLAKHGIRTRPFSSVSSGKREVILATGKPPAPGGATAMAELARHIAAGSNVVFLKPEIFAMGGQPTALLPLAKKGTLVPIWGWLYLKDEWAKRHPIFDGLPSGGLMDYAYYREIIPDLVWQGQEPPAEAVAGAIKASQDYSSGMMVSVYRLGEGRFVLNTLQICENLDGNPSAERLLRNILRYAAQDVEKPAANLPANFDEQLKSMGLSRPQ